MATVKAFTCRGATQRSRPVTATTSAMSTGPRMCVCVLCVCVCVCVCVCMGACLRVCVGARGLAFVVGSLFLSLLSLSLSLSLARSLSLSLALSLSLSLSPPPHPPTHPPSPTPPPPSDRHHLTLSRGSTRALSEMTTRAASTGPRTSRAGRRTRMARTTTCCLSRFCAATRSRPARSGKASTLATVKASSARSMTVWREAPTGP